MAFPAVSWCLNIVWNFPRKSPQVPRVTAVPEMAFLWKVSAQVRADPLVMYERVKAIFFVSVSYDFLLTARENCMECIHKMAAS